MRVAKNKHSSNLAHASTEHCDETSQDAPNYGVPCLANRIAQDQASIAEILASSASRKKHGSRKFPTTDKCKSQGLTSATKFSPLWLALVPHRARQEHS